MAPDQHVGEERQRHLSECASLLGPEFACTCLSWGDGCEFGALVDAPSDDDYFGRHNEAGA